MMLVRRGFLAGLAGLVLLAGCAGAGTAQGPNGEPLEALTVTTSTGEHRFMVEIAAKPGDKVRHPFFAE